MDSIETLEAALGFFAGCTFMAGVLWAFVVTPDRVRIETLIAALEKERDQARDFMSRILRKAGYDV